jgi:antitoxin ChpS
MVSHLRKVGGSVMLAVPPAVLSALHLQVGATVDVVAEGDALVVRQQARPRHTLAELLAQCDPTAPMNAEDREWLSDRPVGSELL